jgi:hypothetical protein
MYATRAAISSATIKSAELVIANSLLLNIDNLQVPQHRHMLDMGFSIKNTRYSIPSHKYKQAYVPGRGAPMYLHTPCMLYTLPVSEIWRAWECGMPDILLFVLGSAATCWHAPFVLVHDIYEWGRPRREQSKGTSAHLRRSLRSPGAGWRRSTSM